MMRPVLLSMVIFYLLMIMTPKIIKKPTGIKIIDETVMYLVATESFVVPGVLLTGLVTYLTAYVDEEFF